MQSQPITLLADDRGQSRVPRETDDEIWKKLYQITAASVRKSLAWINMPASWKGQEADVAEDIVQETMVRTLTCLKQADRGERERPLSLTAFALAVARNYLLDLRRREKRLCLMSSGETNEHELGSEQLSAFDLAVENVETEDLFQRVAAIVAHFPEKQRQAVLVDLASRMHFGKKQTVLQRAFSAEGIQLQDYQRTPPTNSVERSRQAALRNLAYKRVARELSPWE